MSTRNYQTNSAYLAMPDTVNVNLLPVGYPAYLGYVDGNFRTAVQLQVMFPDAELVLLTVTGAKEAHGVRVNAGSDVEPGNMPADIAVMWAAAALKDNPASRPVIYASVQGVPGYGMPWVLAELVDHGILRGQVRLLSAHYGLGPHVCGPDSCKAIDIGMDGTQWTDSYPVPGGVVDMSLLKPDFFQTQPLNPVLPLTGRIMQELGTVRQGDTGAAVRTVQGLCNARQSHMLAIDGVFGPATLAMVRSLQGGAKIPADGVVGPLTWPVLLGVA